jgi:phosphomannomutase
VESSGGFSVSDYLYEKCGFLPAILLAMIGGHRHLPISGLVAEIVDLVGNFVFLEDRFQFDSIRREDVVRELEKTTGFLTLEAPMATSTIDGKKWIWEDGSWVLIRLSGTEPVGRIYAESLNENRTRELVSAGLDWAAQFR